MSKRGTATLSWDFARKSVAVPLLVAAFVQVPAPRENAYRANNVGVAQLEQFDYPAAARSFRRALEIAPDLVMARVNLAIALFYAGELGTARKEAEAARQQDPSRLQADYVLGLIARGENHDAEAVAAFTRVQKADPDDLGSAINLGQLYLQQQKFAEALEAFRRATRLEPYQSTAAYGLATALLRSGAREEGAAAMTRFQELRDSGYATTFSQNYLDQGRYAAAIASTGAERELVDQTPPQVKFTDETAAAVAEIGRGSSSAPALFDMDGDGDLDLALATDGRARLFRNDGKKFSEITARAGLKQGGVSGVVSGDYDNDGRPDLLVLSFERIRLFRQLSDGVFNDVTESANIRAAGERTAAWADADHDGDLDIVEPPRLLRNNGNSTFTDISEATRLDEAVEAVAIVPTDFDNRRDIDFLVLRQRGTPLLLQNMRDGSFRDASQATGLTRSGVWTSVASGDVNKDGFTDFFLCRSDGPGVFAISDGHGRFSLADAPAETVQALAAQFLDYDNDGLLDTFVVTRRKNPTLLRNLGAGWQDVSARAFPASETAGVMGDVNAAIASGDLDGDGDVDVLMARGGQLTVWRNDGGSSHTSLKVRLSARVSNRSALGSKVEIRAGSLSQQIETASATPSPTPADVLFGLGNRGGADVVRVLWPAGILQAEVAAENTRLTGTTAIKELDRKPSSCPYLYTWNGSRFEFITDFLGGGEMGYWLAPGVRNTPDPDEYVRIEGHQLQPRNGRYELRVTNELEEALFLDHARLIAVTHPGGTDVYPNEGMGERAKPFQLYVARDATPPLAASDEHGHDMLDRISAIDRRYPDDFALERVRGYARPHSLTLTLPARRDGAPLLLLLTGWTDYAFSRDNVAASQQGLQLLPPALQARSAGGQWRTVIEDIGVPVGRPQTVPVDLTGVLPPGATEVRITTTMRIYWDRVLVAKAAGFGLQASGAEQEPSGSSPDAQRKNVTVPLASATLRWRGFSAETSADGREPFGYDYARVSFDSPWKLMPGRYTREGDVETLLSGVDDMFVVSRPGDEIALSFNAGALPPLPAGWKRTFLLYADGFSKEMDPHSASPDALAPLPFHGMSRYPYELPEQYPADEAHREYVERYNTRVVLWPVPRLELLAPAPPDSSR